MLNIRRSEIPVYLHGSEFYKSLCDNSQENEEDDNDDNIPIPQVNMKLDTRVSSLEDLQHLLSTLRYWGVERIPVEVLNFIFTCDNIVMYSVLSDFNQELVYLKELVVIKNAAVGLKIELASQYGRLEVLQFLHELGLLGENAVSTSQLRVGMWNY